MDEVECTSCGWSGLRDELVCTDADEDNFSYCPDCESKDFIEDCDYDEEEAD
jgi:NAD-dependent SIR2 family protein deacetylase